MDDVLVPSGGFLPISVDEFGYMLIYPTRTIIHRETRKMNEREDTCFSFRDAKLSLPWEDDVALLELTPEGGGQIIWMREDQRENLTKRLSRWSGCYGRWPIQTFSD